MKVKIKTWKQMEEEYGLTYGLIPCTLPNISYTPEMEKQMPKNRIIEIGLINNEWRWNGWYITNDMISKYY